MTQRDRGFTLRSRDGHFEMVGFDLKRVEGGFWMWVECKFDGHNGGHWLSPDPATSGAITMIYEPYLWTDAVEAFAARDRWESRQGREGRS